MNNCDHLVLFNEEKVVLVIVICHMSKSVLTTRLSDKDYSVKNDQNQTYVALGNKYKWLV